jgi:rare lipoprotein A (peptidoglycan hydrolase)
MNYAAVRSFRFGDSPYDIQICAKKTGRCVIAKVVDHCEGCTGSRLVDLSPVLFEALGIPLHHGVVKITLRRVDGNQGSAYCSSTAR